MSNCAFGVEFYTKDKCALLNEIFKSKNDMFSYVVTPNINHVVKLQSDVELIDAYSSANWRICDSRILQPALSVLGVDIPEVIPGSDLTQDLFFEANEKSLSITIIGADPKEIEEVARKYPRVEIKHHNPPFGFINSESQVQECIDFVIDHKSNFVVLAVGCPRQEVLAHRIHQTHRASGVGLCVGASISFIAGSVRRAPMYIQNMRAEWIFRLMQEPKRLASRYFFDGIRLIPLFCKELWLKK